VTVQCSCVHVRLWVTTVSILLTLCLTSAQAQAAGAGVAPTELDMSLHIGWEVDQATHANVCTVTGAEQCQAGREGGEAGGFSYPASVAIDPRTGNLYVADLDNYRIEQFTDSGDFLAMFGWDVNKTEDQRLTATGAERDICTAASGDWCGAGLLGAAAEQLAFPASLAVAPAGGDVYVLEATPGDYRVDEYAPDGRFAWTIGKEVNDTTKASICEEREIERSGVKCGEGQENTADKLQPAAFKFAPQSGDLLAVGGPEELLYVGDEHRVQEFDASGAWRGEILLASISAKAGSSVGALAVDRDGRLYLVYDERSNASTEHADVIRDFDRQGEEVGQFSVYPELANAEVHIDGIAIEGPDLIAAIGVEFGPGFSRRFGRLYETGTGRLVGEFAPPKDDDGVASNAAGDLFVPVTDYQEVAVYVPAPASELVTSPLACQAEPAEELSVSFECALNRSPWVPALL